jgi:hypothetical protein
MAGVRTWPSLEGVDMSNSYPRETTEFIPITVKFGTVTLTTGVETALTSGNTRPSSWAAADEVDGKVGHTISGLSVGRYTLWTRITLGSELVVIDCGQITIT